LIALMPAHGDRPRRGKPFALVNLSELELVELELVELVETLLEHHQKAGRSQGCAMPAERRTAFGRFAFGCTASE
jgi:hypothetical protein